MLQAPTPVSFGLPEHLTYRNPEFAVAKTKLMPTKIDNRSQLIFALTEVAELEHLLLCQYLFAAASLKTGVDELPNKDRRYRQVELCRDWKAAILRIAREEMQHLSYVNNLLISVGGGPYFARPNFPCARRFYQAGPDDPGLQMSLEAFGPDTVERFIRFETSEVTKPKAALDILAAIPDPNYYETLHEFYTRIRAAFTDDMLIDIADQYDPKDEYEGVVDVGRRIRPGPDVPTTNIVRSAKQAQQLLDEIMQQGEGAPETSKDPRAHVNIFRGIRDALLDELQHDKAFEPARRVVSNPLTRRHDDIPAKPTSQYTIFPPGQADGLPHDLLQLFAGAYEVLLDWLQQIFGGRGPEPERRAIETLVFLPYMSEVIRPLAEILTLVPTKRGSQDRLGASFEVTTNNFMLPSGRITARQTVEALKDLEGRAEKLVGRLTKLGVQPAAQYLDEVRVTFRLLGQEFDSRTKWGWPLDFGWPKRVANYPTTPEEQDAHDAEFTTFSEAPGIFMRPPPGKTDWVPPPVLELEFQGWFQCRLATDPDGAFVRRGVTGNAFAIGDEPDLDRVIRFQAAGTVGRSHCPPIRVGVTAARLLRSALHAPRTGTPVPGLVGAKVNLLGDPKFEGRNHLVCEDGELIDPFELEVRTDDGLFLQRRVVGPPVNDMTPTQRRGSGRYPVSGAQVRLNAMRDNLTHMGDVASPQEFVGDRIARLEEEYKKYEARPLSEPAQAIQFRLNVLKVVGPQFRNVRWTRFFFDCEYFHTLSGETASKLEGVAPAFRVRAPQGDPQADVDAKWLVQYHLGFYDTDALAAYVYGLLRVPVDQVRWPKDG